MSQINVNRIKDSNQGAPDFPSGANISGVTSSVTLGVTNLNPTNVNVTGVVTAGSFDGNMIATGTPTLGTGVTINASGINITGVATAGIVSATTLYGDGTNVTGIAASIAPLNYNPAVFSQASHLTKASGIGLTFNQRVVAGSGNVTLTLANAGAAGTVVENFSVGSSITYTNGNEITITPTADLAVGQDYHLSYPSGAFTNGDVSYVGTAYTFQARSYTYQVWGWGNNDSGQLGQNTAINYSSPVQIPGTTWSYIGMGGDSKMGYGVRSDGSLWAWGHNGKGQLGQNQAEAQLAKTSSPVQVGSDTTWSRGRGANVNSFAVKTDNTLWSWGSNSNGMLGLNAPDNTNQSSPVQIPGTTWDDPPWGGLWSSLVATKSDGTAWAWGSQTYGQLGVNDKASRSSPTQIPGTTWSECRMAGTFIGVKTDGTLWTAGHNSYGSLGQGDTTLRSSPVQIPGTSWKVSVTDGSPIATTGYELFAIRTDGTLWAWGYGLDGLLAQNSRTEYSSPRQVGTETTWRSVDAADNCAVASKTDGTLWMWGENEQGNLGQNNKTNYSSPVQIPGTDWNHLVAGGGKAVLAMKKI